MEEKTEETIKEKLITLYSKAPPVGCHKITIVGAGYVGMACAFCILCRGISNEICIIDENEEKAKGEVMDLRHGSSLLMNAKITGGSDLALSACTRIYIISINDAFAAEQMGSSLDLLDANGPIIRKIIPELPKVSPLSIILMVSDPVDVLTYMAWKLSGFPKHRVIGVGTTLNTACLNFMISKRLKIANTSCDAYVIGEHGDNSIPVWSAAGVSGVLLRDLDETIGVCEDPERWDEVHEEVVRCGETVRNLKGHSNWAIGSACAAIVEAILMNTGEIFTLSTSVKGLYDIDKDIFLSVPCTLNANGVTTLVKLNLTPDEVELFKESADVLSEAQEQLEL